MENGDGGRGKGDRRIDEDADDGDGVDEDVACRCVGNRFGRISQMILPTLELRRVRVDNGAQGSGGGTDRCEGCC